MSQESSIVTSNQTGVHKDLESSIKKHLTYPYKKPYRPFSEEIFHRADEIIRERKFPIILDSGCGTGESSVILSEKNPDTLIVGIDKSEKRLNKFINDENFYHKDNVMLIRADVVDIWRLIKKSNWNIQKHYLLYPNPWPKKDLLKRRWHGHPVFPEMLSLCDQIELRTNWKIYADEFKLVLELVLAKSVAMESIETDSFISPFEKKYYESGHELYRVVTS